MDKKTYSIKIDGIEQNIKNTESLGSNVAKTGNAWREAQKALKDVKAEMVGLDKNSKQWQDLAKVAGDYRDRLDDINQAARRFASDTKGLDDAINIGQSMTSVFTLAQGAMSAFGLSTEGVVESIQKLQGAMAILQSLQTLQNTLRGSTATTDLLTKSIGLMTKGMAGASATAKALRLALMGIGIGLLIGLVATLIEHWDDLTKSLGFATDAQKKLNEAMEAGNAAYSKGKAELEAYNAKLKNFNGTKEQEKYLVDELNKKYGEAFGHYKTLGQWKDILNKKTVAYCNTLALEAQMQVKVNQLSKQYEERNEFKKDFDRIREGDLTYWEQIKDFVSPGSSISTARDKFNDARNGVSKLEAEIDELAKKIVENNMDNDLFMGGLEKTKKSAKSTAKEVTDITKNILDDLVKAERKASEEIEEARQKAFDAEKDRLEKLDKLRKGYANADVNYQKQRLKLDLANAKTDEEKLEIRKKIIDLDEKIDSEEKKIASADAMGISVDELNNRLSNTEATYMGLNEEQKTIMQTLITQLGTVKIAAEEARNVLSGESGGKKSEKKKSALSEWFGNEYTQEFMTLGEDTFNVMADSISMMMDWAITEAKEKLNEVTELHDSAVEKVEESQTRIAELNDKMKDASGSRLEAYKQQLADEVLLQQQRETEEKRLAKDKEKREKELRKREKDAAKAEVKMQIAQAIINTSMGVTKAFAQFGFPMGPIFGAILSTLGTIEVAMMTKQLSKMADGGLLQGRSHAEGGIPVGNTGIEVEGGEYVVNKRSTNKYLPLLQALNEEGARKKTKANQIGKFADGGELNFQRISDNADAISTNRILANAISGIDFHPTVSVVDINRGQRNLVQVRQLAGADS